MSAKVKAIHPALLGFGCPPRPTHDPRQLFTSEMSIPTYLEPQFRNREQPSDAVSDHLFTCYPISPSILAVLTLDVLAILYRSHASIPPSKPNLERGPSPRVPV